MESPKCYSCRYKRNVPGDAHIQCVKPDPGMIGDPHGIKNGWFMYPVNFDPIWMAKECSKYCSVNESEFNSIFNKTITAMENFIIRLENYEDGTKHTDEDEKRMEGLKDAAVKVDNSFSGIVSNWKDFTEEEKKCILGCDVSKINSFFEKSSISIEKVKEKLGNVGEV